MAFDVEILKSCPEGTWLIGIDEVGRGSCIGPVMAGAVCFPANLTATQKKNLKTLDDSKELTPLIRAALCASLQEHCLHGLGVATKDEVEKYNVYHASLLAGYRAYEALLEKLPEGAHEKALILLDGKAIIPDLPRQRQKAIIQGDGKSFAIAAASVIAKHVRDSYVIELAREYPGYGWETNMGYGTPEHREALARLGPTPHHRSHFKAVLDSQLILDLD